jgi:hypothetical protein
MHYTVAYDPQALAALTRYWINAPDQQAVANAANEIDRLLKTSPSTCGQPFHSLRRLTVGPLEVLYGVSQADCLVYIISVRLVSPP